MKKYLFFAASALALASCSSDDFVGDNSGNLHGTTNGEIAFAGGTAKITRAGNHVGANAAELLGNKFIVAGFKSDATAPTTGISTNPVFDHYTVNWKANTAGTTADNTSDWMYVGLAPQVGLSGITEGKQTIKYWDYSAAQYDYIAFSTGKAELVTNVDPTDGQVKVTKVNAVNATDKTKGAYTIKGKAEDLSKCYIADLVTAYKSKEGGTSDYKNEVTLSFRNLTTKVRVALYETIPGYSVKDVKFYSNNTTQNSDITGTEATLFTEGNETNNKFYGSGTATVYFPTVGYANISKSDYNKAHVAIAGSDESTSKNFGNLDYTNSDDPRLGTDKIYLATKSSEATYATGKSHYEIVLPNETGTTLTLRVNYTLVANDGSGEKINVYGAKAIIPAIYAEWKSNYAYTYIFKISDKTNGMTGMTTGPEGLYPITFDAVVADSEEGNQSTITTVATPSITTYQKGHDITKDEYSAAKGDIYVMAMNKDGILISDLDKAVLYTVKDPKAIGISEATVHDALTIGATNVGATTVGAITTGRNGIELTVADKDATITTIPGIDGNNIDVTAKTAAKFTPAAGTYAFVYDITPTTAPASTELHTAVTVAAGTDLTNKEYFNDEACTDSATGTTTTEKVYYQKITNTNRTYAIKVIKVVN